VQAPEGVEVVLRRRGQRRLVHLLNLLGGGNAPRAGMPEHVPPLGPITVTLDLPQAPERVYLACEEPPLEWGWRPTRRGGGTLTAIVPQVQLHTALVVE